MKLTYISLTACLLMVCPIANANETNNQFDDPVPLLAGDAPINENNRMWYPSPAIFDVDQDGQDELVIGTIFGQVYSCENSSPNRNEPVWEEPTEVKTVDGKPLKLNNW